MTTKRPSIITQHDYISINFGNNRRLTSSYSGQKASGCVPPCVFNEFCRRMEEKSDVKYGERMQKFVEEIDTIWPAWNVPARQFRVGEKVNFYFGKSRGVHEVEVVKVRGTSVTIKDGNGGLIRMSADLLESGNL